MKAPKRLKIIDNKTFSVTSSEKVADSPRATTLPPKTKNKVNGSKMLFFIHIFFEDSRHAF